MRYRTKETWLDDPRVFWGLVTLICSPVIAGLWIGRTVKRALGLEVDR